MNKSIEMNTLIFLLRKQSEWVNVRWSCFQDRKENQCPNLNLNKEKHMHIMHKASKVK